MKDVGMRIIKLFKSGIGRMKIFESKNVAVKAGLVLLYGLAGVVRAHPRPKGGALRKKMHVVGFYFMGIPFAGLGTTSCVLAFFL